MLMHGRTVPQTADNWANEHGHRLDPMTRGRSRAIVYRDISDMDVITSRLGSEIYTAGDEYSMLVVALRTSDVAGAPTMPIWQWYKHTPKKRTGTS
jgi:hypothetical protein